MTDETHEVPNARINAVHHLAISTADMKGQIEFFSEVLGAELVALFWMHGVPGAWHGFCRLNDHCSVAFTQVPGNEAAEPNPGVTHAGTAAGTSAPGTTQHIAFNVDSHDELLAMRDRIRSKGVNVIGHIEHGICTSIYFAGPEGLTLEVATSEDAIDPQAWIDPEVVELAGITPDDLARYTAPEPYAGRGGTVAQPPIDAAKPQLAYPPDVLERIVATPDERITSGASYAEPPVEV